MDNTKQPFIPYDYVIPSEETVADSSKKFLEKMDKRRTIREFSDMPVPQYVIENIIMAASSAPSGAHKQPWVFCAIQNPEIKRKIREAAEKEEYENYHGRMPERWLQDLQPFETNWHKPFLEIAPWLIVVFKKPYELIDGEKVNNYYVTESVGLASGFLLTAIHNAGLVSLTHTPSPMNFLQKVLERPENEKPFLLIPVGYPAEGVRVPDLKRKELKDVMVVY